MKTLVEGKDFYHNDLGLMVLTREYHLERGVCCGNGCMHCPFGFVNVKEPKRQALLKKKADETNKEITA